MMLAEAIEVAKEVVEQKTVFGITQANLNSIGIGIASLGGVAASVWGWVILQKKKLAENQADRAEARTEMVIADAQGTVYKLLEARVITMEEEMRAMRLELSTERAHSRAVEQKLYRLEAWIRSQNLTPPIL